MRVAIEAIAAQHGGLLTYVQALARTWPRVAPDDEVTIIVDAQATHDLVDHGGVRVLPVRLGPSRQLGRLAIGSAVTTRETRRADVLLATLPVLPLAGLGRVPTAVIVHDLRHRLRPQEFSRATRLQRNLLYTHALRRADLVLAVSTRTKEDVAKVLQTRRPIEIVPHGADHIDAASDRGPGRHGLAQGHFANKDVDLVLRSWKVAAEGANPKLGLVITGVSPDARNQLAEMADQLGITSFVDLKPWLDDAAFAEVMRDAAVLVFPSRFEGFGLPVLEAMRRWVPVVISPDPALLETAGGHAEVSASWEPRDVGAAIQRATKMSDANLAAAAEHAASFTWAKNVALIREHLRSIARHGSAKRSG